MSRPNVVVIIADQLKADLLGCYGHGGPRTPAIDSLAERGTRFDEATVANPTCMPNRASMLTGRWPSTHGTRTNGIPLDEDARTFATQAREAGYHTAAVGKLHLQTMGFPFEGEQLREIEARDPWLLDPEVPDAAPRARSAVFDRCELPDDADRVRPAGPYYGFETVDLAIGHGDAVSGDYLKWAGEHGVDPLSLRGRGHASQAYEGWEQVYRTAVPAEVHSSAFVADRACARMRALAGKDAPFLLVASFPDPHHPYAVPEGYADRYAPDEIELPSTFAAEHVGAPPHLAETWRRRGTPDDDWTVTWSPTEEQMRHAAAAEFGLVELLDDSVGVILDEIQRLGIADSTVVVFTADHGDFFGDHGLLLKHFAHYRAVTRVPLILALPGRDADVSSALVSTPDIAATILELTGAVPFRGIQGRSLLPVLDGAPGRDAVLVEEDLPFGTAGLPGPVRMRTLLTRHARLTRYIGTDLTELYDHEKDPLELRNVADDPCASGLRATMVERMLEEVALLDDEGVRLTSAA